VPAVASVVAAVPAVVAAVASVAGAAVGAAVASEGARRGGTCGDQNESGCHRSEGGDPPQPGHSRESRGGGCFPH